MPLGPAWSQPLAWLSATLTDGTLSLSEPVQVELWKLPLCPSSPWGWGPKAHPES